MMYCGIVKFSCIAPSHWRNGKIDDSRPAVGGIWRLWKSTADLGRGIAYEITADDITFPTIRTTPTLKFAAVSRCAVSVYVLEMYF